MTATWTNKIKHLPYLEFLMTESNDYLMTEDLDYLITNQSMIWKGKAKNISVWSNNAKS